MALNLISPVTFTTGALIGNEYQSLEGSSDNIPTMTKVGGKTVDAALELQSDNAAFLCTRLFQESIDSLVADDGMLTYNKTTSQFNMRVGGIWENIGEGDVIGPDSSITGDIAIFADESGKLLADSGINIALANPPSPLIPQIDPFLRISNFSELSFTSVENALTIDDRLVAVFTLPDLTLEPNTIFTDSTFNPDGPLTSALLQINSTRATFLNARMSSPQVTALNPVDGMQVYDKTLQLMLFRQNNQWVPLSSVVGGAPVGATYILGTENPLLNNAQSLGNLTTGLLKNTVDSLEGILSRADPGVDYYAPGFPTYIIDTADDTTGGDNLFVGTRCGKELLAGTNNIGLGIDNLFSIEDSSGNVSIGVNTSQSIVGGGGNVIVGNSSFSQAIDPINTIAIGNIAASIQDFYDSCVFVGTGSDATTNTLVNAIAIGADTQVSSSNTFVLGNQCNVVIGGSIAPYTLNVNLVNNQSALFLASNEDSPSNPPEGGILYVKEGLISGYDLFFNGERLNSSAFDIFNTTDFIVGSSKPTLPFSQSLGGLGPVGSSALLKNSITTNTIPGFPNKGTLSNAVPVPLGSDTGDYYAPGFPIYIRTTTPPLSSNLFIGDSDVGYIGNSPVSINNTAVGIGSFTKAKDGFGQANTFIGAGTAKTLEFGNYNTAVGNNALGAAKGLPLSSSDGTTAIGTNAAASQDKYNNCTFLGYATDAIISGLTNATAIGYRTVVGISNALILGKEANVGIGVHTPGYTLELGNVISNDASRLPMCTIAFSNTTNAPPIPTVNEGGFIYVFNDDLYYNGRLVSFDGIHGEPDNLFVGESCGNATLSGDANVGTGLQVFTVLDTATRNIVLGAQSLNKLTAGQSNIGIGISPLRELLNASNNIAIGDSALSNITNSNNNTVIGILAGEEFGQYNNCTFIGMNADASVGNLTNAIAIGYNAVVGADDTVVLGNKCSVAIGTSFARYTLSIDNVEDDAAIGLFNSTLVPTIPTAGDGGVIYVFNDLLYYNGQQISNSVHGEPDNLFVGATAGNDTLDGTDNVGVGIDVLKFLTSGNNNFAGGFNALILVESGQYNIAIGTDPLSELINGERNIAIGSNVLENITGANNNVAVGDFSLQNLETTNSNNVAVGFNAGTTQDSLNGCTFIGMGADALSNNLTNATAIGFGATVRTSNSLVLGADANIGINISDPLFTLSLGNVHNGDTGVNMCVISFQNTDFEPGVPIVGEGGRLYVREEALYFNGQPVGTGGDPNATYVLLSEDAALPNSFPIGSLTTGLLKNTVTAGVGALTTAIPVPPNSDSGDYYAPGFPVHIIVDTLKITDPIPPVSNLMVLPDLPLTYGTALVGSFNTIMGTGSFYLATGASENCAFGSTTLAVATTASFNSVFGNSAGTSLITGNQNTLIGSSSGFALTNASQNSALGVSTLLGQTLSSGNVAVGFQAGSALTPSFGNCTFLGTLSNSSSAYFSLTPGASTITNSVAVGYNATVGTGSGIGGTVTNSIALGANVVVTQSDTVALGNNCLVGIGNNAPIYGLHIGENTTTFQAYIGLEQNAAATAPADPTSAVVLYNGNGPTNKDFFCVTPTNTVNLTTNQAAFILLNGDNLDNSPVMPNQAVVNLDGAPGYIHYDSGNLTLQNPPAQIEYASKDAHYVLIDDHDKPNHDCQVLKDLAVPIELQMLKLSASGHIEIAAKGTDYTTGAEVDEKITAALVPIEGEIAGLEAEIDVVAGEATTALGVATGAVTTAGAALAATTALSAEVGHLETETYVIRTPSTTLTNASPSLLELLNATVPTNTPGYLYITGNDPTSPTDVNLSIQAGSGGGGADVNATYLLVSNDVTLPFSTSLESLGTSGYLYYLDGVVSLGDPGAGSGGAPNNASYILQFPDASLTSGQALSLLSTGILKSATGTGVVSTAVGGTDYYGPGAPTYIVDTHGTTANFFIGNNTGSTSSPLSIGNLAVGSNIFPGISGTSVGNIGIGNSTLTAFTGGNYNVMVGYQSMIQATSATSNVGVGTQVFSSATSITGSVAIGHFAAFTQTAYDNCIFIGNNANAGTNNLSNAVAIGANTSVNTKNSIVLGNSCYVGIGTPVPLYPLTLINVSGPTGPLSCVVGMANTANIPAQPTSTLGGLIYISGDDLYYSSDTGTFNISDFKKYSRDATYILQKADGHLPNAQSLGTLTTGLLKNNSVGTEGILSTAFPGIDYYADGAPTTIIDSGSTANVFVGTNSGNNTISGSENTGFGSNIAPALTSGNSNSAIGANALSSIVDGSTNTALGKDALELIVSSNGTTAVGHRAAATQLSYHSCVFVGENSDATVNGLTNSIAIGANSQVSSSNTIVLGNGANVTIGGSNAPYNLTLNNINNESVIYFDSSISTPIIPVGGGILYVFNDDLYYNGDIVSTSTNVPPLDANYILQTADVALPAAQSLGTLTTGLLKNNITGISGTLSTASPGVDYYAPTFPTIIRDSGASFNVFLGTNTGNPSVSGTENTGFGSNIMPSLASGNSNTSVGTRSLQALTSGSTNTGIGKDSFKLITNSSGNTGLGHLAGSARIAYTNCTFLGTQTDASVSGLSNATAVGYNASVSISNALILGNGAKVGIGTSDPSAATLTLNNISSFCDIYLQNTTTIPLIPGTGGGLIYTSGDDLFYSGKTRTVNLSASADAVVATYITQTPSTFLANEQALSLLSTGLLKNTTTTGVLSAAVGVAEGSVTGDYYGPGLPTLIFDNGISSPYNLFIGKTSNPTPRTSVTGSENLGIGTQALSSLTGGHNNVGIGSNSLPLITIGDNNTGVGRYSLHLASTSSSSNTGVGAQAGSTFSSYTNCTFLGFLADTTVNSLTNATAIGYNTKVTTSNSLILGNGANVGIGTSSPLNKLHVVGTVQQKGIVTNYTGTDLIKGQNGIQTTNGTATTILSIPIPTSPAGALNVSINIAAQQSTNANAATGFGTGGAFFNGTTSTILTNTVTLNTTLLWLVGATFAISGNNLNLNVTGIGGQTINWVVSYEYFSVRNVIT